MKRLTAVIFLGTSVFCGQAQISQVSGDVIRTPELLYITTSLNVTAISNTVKIASSLRINMTKQEVDNYLHERGMQTNAVETNLWGLSFDRGRTMSYFCPLLGDRSSLVLEMECTERPASGFRGWKNPVLKKAYIQSQGENIISIALTNGARCSFARRGRRAYRLRGNRSVSRSKIAQAFNFKAGKRVDMRVTSPEEGTTEIARRHRSAQKLRCAHGFLDRFKKLDNVAISRHNMSLNEP